MDCAWKCEMRAESGEERRERSEGDSPRPAMAARTLSSDQPLVGTRLNASSRICRRSASAGSAPLPVPVVSVVDDADAEEEGGDGVEEEPRVGIGFAYGSKA